MITLDGTQIREIIDRIGGPAAPGDAAVAELEHWLGRPLPAETAELLRNKPRLVDPDAAGQPVEFYAGLPDVEAFLAQLASERVGPLIAACHFLGLIPVAVRCDGGDPLYALAAIDGYGRGDTGGIFYYNQREIGPLAPTASQWLIEELRIYRAAAAAGDLYDCYRLATDHSAPLEIAPLPDAIVTGFAAHADDRTGGRDRFWIPAALRGEIAAWALDALPTPERWETERPRVARFHGDAMYWLLTHAILGNRNELADAASLSESNPSRLVAALRDYLLTTRQFVDHLAAFRTDLYDLINRRSFRG